MKKCQACGYENTDDSLFCSECGKKLEEKPVQKFCQHCGTAVAPGSLFCGECGKPLQSLEEKITSQVVEEKPAPKLAPAQDKKKNMLPIIIVAAVLCVVAIGVGIFFVTQGGFGGNDSDRDSNIEENIDDDEESEETEEVYETQEPEDTEATAEVDTTKPIPLTTSMEVSSVLSEMEFNAIAMVDGNASTAWGDGVEGYGVGEYFKFTLQSEATIYGIAILPGNLASANDFYNYGYPTEFEITAGDTSQTVQISYYTPNFDFTGNPYVFLTFEEPVYTKELTVTITAVKEGIGTDVTCITELRLFTYPAAGEEVNVSADAWTVSSTNTGDYMLPNSDSAFLTMEDLAGFTAEDCRIARNELYARYGRRFTDETLQAHFDSKDWYVGTTDPEEFNEDILNEYEVHNRDLIIQYEEENGFR